MLRLLRVNHPFRGHGIICTLYVLDTRATLFYDYRFERRSSTRVCMYSILWYITRARISSFFEPVRQPRYLCEKARLMSFHAPTIVLGFGLGSMLVEEDSEPDPNPRD